MTKQDLFKWIHFLSRDFFYVAGMGYLFYFCVELWEPGLITRYFNLNYLLVACLVSSFIMALTHQNYVRGSENQKISDSLR